MKSKVQSVQMLDSLMIPRGEAEDPRVKNWRPDEDIKPVSGAIDSPLVGAFQHREISAETLWVGCNQTSEEYGAF